MVMSYKICCVNHRNNYIIWVMQDTANNQFVTLIINLYNNNESRKIEVDRLIFIMENINVGDVYISRRYELEWVVKKVCREDKVITMEKDGWNQRVKLPIFKRQFSRK